MPIAAAASAGHWSLLEAGLAVEALRMALARREVEPGLVHHSDRGVQYASSAYTDLLKEQGIRISMSQRVETLTTMRRPSAS